ncbi:ATP-binding cassette domain-containing protein [Oleisolibacter albus]|uniref:ATP-binding cassette domain-containing protein n=1 Tax=Oleisolibacter albus TaxID=2171757 RepID=UPI000DF459E9|nr:ATP-binding cassette domain-containing protein [Oleisolibacter albus]
MPPDETVLRTLLDHLQSGRGHARTDGTDPARWRQAAPPLGLRLRRVRPHGADWWRRDLGPLLVTLAGRPALLLPRPGRIPLLVTAADEPGRPLDEGTATALGSDAFMPYPRFPRDRRGLDGWWSLHRLDGAPPSWAWPLAAALAQALPALLLARGPGWTGLAAGLALAGAAAALATVSRLADGRHRGRLISQRLQATVWDRLLDLPAERVRRQPATAWATAAMRGLAGAHRRLAAASALDWGLCGLLVPLAALSWLSPATALAVSPALAALTGLGWVLTEGAERQNRRAGRAREESGPLLTALVRALPQQRQAGTAAWLSGRVQALLTRELAADRSAAWRRAAADRLRFAGALLTLPPVLAVAPLPTLPPGQDPGILTSGPLLLAALLLGLQAGAGSARLGHALGLDRSGRRDLAALEPVLALPPDSGAGAPVPAFDSLTAEDLSFTHPGAARPLFHGLGFQLARGQVLALVGPSGVGKTTLIRLLAGLDQPTTGRIAVDGVTLAHLDPAGYRAHVAAVFQDDSVAVQTVRSAVAGNGPLDGPAIWAALRFVGLEPAVTALPMGVQTLVAQGLFPGGLVHQLLLARALARRPRLLLLDEALAFLDVATVRPILEALRAQGMMIVLTSHRPEITALADRVIDLTPAG